MRKMKSGIYERNKELHSRAYDRAPLMKDKFPMLTSLSIEMTFEEPDWGGNPRPRHDSYGPESKTFFSIECPYAECISVRCMTFL